MSARPALLPLVLGFALGLGVVKTAVADDAMRPVVVELFTSQGCSSCPPADALMMELAERGDVVAITLPIDYWDNYGWRDTFASPLHSARQRGYAKRLPNRRVYTPQMVVNGRHDVIGTHREEIVDLIRSEIEKAKSLVGIELALDGKVLTIVVADAPSLLAGLDAEVWLAPFHLDVKSVTIGAGENRGRTVDYAHVTEGLTRLGAYRGVRIAFDHPLEPLLEGGIGGCAVFVQEAANGPIIAAAQMELPAEMLSAVP